MSTGKPAGKGPNILGALMDFLILVLLVGGAGFGGYFWGTMQKMAPVQSVPPGTPGAVPASTTTASPVSKPGTGTSVPTAMTTPGKEPAAPSKPAETIGATEAKPPEPVAETKSGPRKYWIASSGTDYIGYSITVNVNGTDVDSFFGPGKTVNVSSKVKPGDNTISFNSEQLGEGYNRHKGDSKSELVLQLVTGPEVKEDFKSSDVILTYKRNASETEKYTDTKHFKKDQS